MCSLFNVSLEATAHIHTHIFFGFLGVFICVFVIVGVICNCSVLFDFLSVKHYGQPLVDFKLCYINKLTQKIPIRTCMHMWLIKNLLISWSLDLKLKEITWIGTFIVKSERKPSPEVSIVIPRAHAATYNRPRAGLASKARKMLDRNGGDGNASGVKCWCITRIKTYDCQDNIGENDNDVEVGHLL